LTAAEIDTIQRLAKSRTEPARMVERARTVWLAHPGLQVSAIAQALRLCQATVRSWLKRFNRRGLARLQDAPRRGRPATYIPEQVSAVILTSLTKPQELGLPIACCTLDRLAASLQEVKGSPIKRSRIDELLLRGGVHWRMQETWFGEQVDPAFAKQGAHHDALHHATAGQGRRVPG
jgi:transposase